MFVSLYDLGGSQADANLFPDVDSTWKVYFSCIYKTLSANHFWNKY